MRSEAAPSLLDRAALRPRILHIGFGAFARAHQMVYLESLASDWGVVACRLHSGVDGLEALAAQDHRYHVVEVDDSGAFSREIGAVCATLHPARDGVGALLDRISDPELAIIALTITEKGYCLRDGRLDQDHDDIRADLAAAGAPRSAIGVIVAGLARRRDTGGAGLSVMSCDNLADNGAKTRAAVLDYAEARDPALARWIADNVAFPATMVDRIVPALDEDGLDLIEQTTGMRDRNSILTEPFRQWVIEDDFAAGRPDWEQAGAQLVADVAPYEEMKLRMLNGAHTMLACLGALAGRETVADCMADETLRAAVLRLMRDEQAATLRPTPGFDLEDYADRLIARFSNSRLQHRTRQIAADSSAKLPQRLVAPAADHLRRGAPWPLTALAIAGWMRFVRRTVSLGETLSDPLAARLREIVAQTGDGEAFVAAMLGLEAVFPADLAADPAFADPIRAAYADLRAAGVAAALHGRLRAP